MKKFLPFSRRQPSLDRFSVIKSGFDRSGGKSMRRILAASLNSKSIQIVRGAYNIDLNKVDSSFTKLHRACLLNDELEVRKHIFKVDINSRDSSNRYPIHLATVNGNCEIVRLLVENQANLNVQDNDGSTPLIKSVECGHERLVIYFINNGADPNIPDLDNNTALHWAISKERIIAVDSLLSSKKCDLSLRNNKDETYLHLAVRCPIINTIIFESMIRDGCDPLAKDQLGFTAFDIAQACNNKIAMNLFSKYQPTHLVQESNKNDTEIPGDIEDKEASMRKMCDDIRLKYKTKSQENLECEKRLIQLNSQVERLKLDMSFLREQNEKLERDYDKLSAENNKMRQENSDLLEKFSKIQQGSIKGTIDENLRVDAGLTGESDGELALDEISSMYCRGHKEFLLARAYLQEKINESKMRLSVSQGMKTDANS